MNVHTKFEVRTFTRSCDNSGTQKIWLLPGYANAAFFQNFNGVLFGWTLSMCPCSTGSRWMVFGQGYEEKSEGVGLVVPCSSFEDVQPM